MAEEAAFGLLLPEKDEFNVCQAIRELMEECKILNGIVKYFQISEENAKEYLQETQFMVK